MNVETFINKHPELLKGLKFVLVVNNLNRNCIIVEYKNKKLFYRMSDGKRRYTVPSKIDKKIERPLTVYEILKHIL
jgi:hypothetical protein